LAQALPFEKPILDKINDESKFALSNLGRAVFSSHGAKMFELEFDDTDGKLYMNYDKKEFLKPYVRLILDMVSDDFNSRTANKASDIDDYFRAYHTKFLPDKTIAGRFSIEDLTAYANTLKSLEEVYAVNSGAGSSNGNTSSGIGATTGSGQQNTSGGNSGAGSTSNNAAGGATAATTGGGTRTGTTGTGRQASSGGSNSSGTPTGGSKAKVRKRTSLIYNDVSVNRNVSKQRVTLIVNELKKIDLDKYKNASGVLLRTLLEVVTHEFLKSLGEDKLMMQEAQANLKQGQKLREYWTPELYPMLSRIAGNKYGLPSTTLSALNKHLTMKGPQNILFLLNEIVHSPDFIYTKQDLLDIYDKLEPYLKEVL